MARPDTEIDAQIKQAWLELTSMVTELTSAWWEVEHALAMLLAALSSMRHVAADVILGTATSNRLKRDIVLNVARVILARAADLKGVEKILARMARAASTRNQFAHAGFGLHHERGRFYLRVLSLDAREQFGLFTYEYFSKKDLENVKNQFAALRNDTVSLAFVLKKARRRRRIESWKL